MRLPVELRRARHATENILELLSQISEKCGTAGKLLPADSYLAGNNFTVHSVDDDLAHDAIGAGAFQIPAALVARRLARGGRCGERERQ